MSTRKIDVILPPLQLSEIHCEFDIPLTMVYLHTVAAFDSIDLEVTVWWRLKYSTGMQHARAEAPEFATVAMI